MFTNPSTVTFPAGVFMPCLQKASPPHSLHTYLSLPCSQRSAPSHYLHNVFFCYAHNNVHLHIPCNQISVWHAHRRPSRHNHYMHICIYHVDDGTLCNHFCPSPLCYYEPSSLLNYFFLAQVLRYCCDCGSMKGLPFKIPLIGVLFLYLMPKDFFF